MVAFRGGYDIIIRHISGNTLETAPRICATNDKKRGNCYAAGTDSVCDNLRIDADLQQRPEVVLEMLDVMNFDEDTDCVTAYQESRKENKGLDKFFSWIEEL